MAKNTYVMNEQQVENLAAERLTAATSIDSFDGTYLRVLVTAAQAKLGKKTGRMPSTDAQLTVIDEVSAPFYAAVLRGVTTPEIAIETGLAPEDVTTRTRERNRRATFARTAKSTIVAWVREGGDLRAVNAHTVTKTEMRSAVVAARQDRLVPAARAIEKGQAMILAAVAREGPTDAREYLTAVIEALQETLDGLEDDTPHESTTIRTRVGTPTFREPARVLNRPAA